ncbi:HNH endonuclease [Acidocella sp.]|uniref:HNH endonuclease n=1 Tax=Acidocella sp. TaxID=50710 RepID=UPI00184C72AA|nr:HNH endonuclease [Acidocella sp.]NNM56234.1 HNH endonuclease [Acidocella sp.]
MLCIFCSEERPPSLEHVFPLAIGGTITTDRVCEPCNSMLGTRVDAALSDFFPIRTRRAQLRLAGNSGNPPVLHEIFLGQVKLIGQTADRAQTTFNTATGKLDTRQLYHATEIVTPDGKKTRQITVDERDKDQIPIIIQRERKRHGLPPLSDEQLSIESKNYTVNSIDSPLVQVSLSVSFAYLRHAMMKIAYELAFLWLGESYLADPLAADLRAAICKSDLASTDNLPGYVGEAENCPPFTNFWTPHQERHLAYAQIVGGTLIIAVRVFDIYAAAIVVSKEPGRYFRRPTDSVKLRYLAIDAVSGKTIDTTFEEESKRLLEAMRQYQRRPPFTDPLSSSEPEARCQSNP